jgi:hypothetical protein
VSERVEYYHCERNHQGVGNRLLIPAEQRRDPLTPTSQSSAAKGGGPLNCYYRRTA